MKYLLTLVLAIIVTFTSLAFTTDLVFNDLAFLTATYSSVASAVVYLIIALKYEHNYHNRRKYAKALEGMLDLCKVDLVETESQLEAEKELHNKLKQRHKGILDFDQARINVGDEVTPVARYKLSTVYAIRQDSPAVLKEYQLSKGGKWYSLNEIRKIVPTDYAG